MIVTFRIYVGPTTVTPIADALRGQFGGRVTVEGTEHVHFTIAAPTVDAAHVAARDWFARAGLARTFDHRIPGRLHSGPQVLRTEQEPT